MVWGGGGIERNPRKQQVNKEKGRRKRIEDDEKNRKEDGTIRGAEGDKGIHEDED
jgi:hypothetical protein